jgi:2Fe-2S ferredoxin
MPSITFIDADGARHVVAAKVGTSLMSNAVRNGVAGIVAECGGSCACGTCRVYVAEAWRPATGEARPVERETLEFAGETDPAARLSCQIPVTEDLDGLVVRMPASQY